MKWTGGTPSKPHPMGDGRRVPIKSLIRKMDLEAFDKPAPWTRHSLRPSTLLLPLKQSAGSPAQPTVRVGDRVRAGTVIGRISPDELGAPLHAPLDGRVVEVTDQLIRLEIP
jgi:Na+-translocating ferredoxin:NAD+ oxidoreductase RnfC subunit